MILKHSFIATQPYDEEGKIKITEEMKCNTSGVEEKERLMKYFLEQPHQKYAILM